MAISVCRVMVAKLALPDDVQVVGQRGRTARRRPGRRRGRGLLDDLADLLPPSLASVRPCSPSQVQHHVGRFAIGALGASARGERVTPEVLDVLNMLGILAQRCG